MIDALVLAGSINNGPLRACSQEKHEALIKIGPDPMVNYVINALRSSGQVNQILVVSPSELKTILPSETIWIECGKSLMENIKRGCASMDRPSLIATADIPLLTPESVNEFLSLCGDYSNDLYYPLVSRETLERRFPEARRTYVQFKEGVFTGGNIFLVNPMIIEKCLVLGQELADLRKKPLALARRVGISMMLKMLFRVLSLTEVQEKASRLLGIKGKAVICNYPEVGMDVDKPADLQLVSHILGYELKGKTSEQLYGSYS